MYGCPSHKAIHSFLNKVNAGEGVSGKQDNQSRQADSFVGAASFLLMLQQTMDTKDTIACKRHKLRAQSLQWSNTQFPQLRSQHQKCHTKPS